MTYKEAAALLAGRQSKKIANNTYLERRDSKTIAVRLHSTDIVILKPSYVELNDGGYPTPTTWDRMRRFSPVQIVSNGKRGMVICPTIEKRTDYGTYRAADWDTQFVYYSGIRLKPDGSGILKTQPNRPVEHEPVVTVSGWTGLSRGDSNRRRREAWSGGFTSAVYAAQEERAIRADETLSIQEKREALAVPDTQRTFHPQTCPFLILVPEHYSKLGYCKCAEPEEQRRMIREWDYTAEDFRINHIRYRGNELTREDLEARFNLSGALWLFASQYHSGQSSRGYRLLSRLVKAGYEPGQSLQAGEFETEAQEEIYNRLVQRYASKV